MRHLIGSYLLAEARLWSPLQVEELSLNLDSLRGITLTHDDDPHLKHFSLIARSKKHFANKRVILLVRNPLDAIVSFFYQFHLRGGRDLLGMPNIEVRLDDFPAFEFGGLPNIVAFLNAWGRYIDSGGNVRIESYEALHRDSNVVLREALTYFGITPVDQELVRNASLRSTFSAMRRLETEGTLADPRLLPGDVLKKDTFKTREGRVGGYRDVLSATTIDWALEYISKNLLYPQMVEMS
jgi:hypothetical protein